MPGTLSFLQVAAVTVIQSLCGSPCYFGAKQESSLDLCQCHHGYWGAACDKACPGGADNSCSGFGSCDQSTGTCSCPVNRRDSSCSSCSPGWLGESCEVSDASAASPNSPAIYRAWLQTMGHVVNADGLGFYVNNPGVYSLMAVSDRLMTQSKFIRCFENFTCATFVSLLAGDGSSGYARITVQAPSLNDGKPEVYISGSAVSVDSDIFFHGVTVSRKSLTELLVSVTPDVSIIISSCGLYLTVAMEIPARYLTSASGLLSGSASTNSSEKLQHLNSIHTVTRMNFCNGIVSEQQPLSVKSSTSVLGGLSPATLTATANATLDIATFLVPDCEVFLHYPSESHRRQRSSGFSLLMGGSAVYTNFSLPDTASELTVEFMVRQLLASEERQVLFSFTHQHLLLIYLHNNTIFVDATDPTNSSSHNTGVGLNMGEWNKIVFTYDDNAGTLTFYHFNSSAWLERRDFIIQPGLFSTPGVLAVGSWQPPYDGAPHPRVYPFAGEVENLLVWDSMIEPNLVIDVWLMDPNVARPALTAAWTFDEGHGLMTFDLVGGHSLLLPPPPLDKPEWLASDVDYVLTRRSGSSVDRVLAAARSAQGSDTCSDFITDLNITGCASLSNATKQDLHALCHHTLHAVPYKQAALSTTLTYAAMCLDSLAIPESQIQTVCAAEEAWNELPSCSQSCLFGASAEPSENSSECSCASGYYGPRCQGICPGGSGSPCSHHGACRDDGTCSCLWNWGGSSDCSTCSSDYTGTDCSILTALPLTAGGKNVAVVTTTADAITFSGLQVSLSGLHGVYTLLKNSGSNPSTEVQVMLVRCSYGSCTAGVALTHDGHNITMLPSPHGILPDVYVNGSRLLLPVNRTFSSALALTTTSVNSLAFNLGGDVVVDVMMRGSYVEVVVKADSSACGSSDGLLDVCKVLAQSLYQPIATKSLKDLNSQIEADFRVTGGDVLFQLSDEQDSFSASSASSYSLSFNGTSAWSGPITVAAASTGLEDFTFSIHVKPRSHGGTLLSFGKNTTFAITNNNPVKVKCGGAVTDTGLSFTLDQWNQLIMTFLQSEKVVHVFVYSEDTTIQHRVLPLQCSATIVSGAVMSLGEWVPSPDETAQKLRETFSGEVDEVVVWSRPIPTAVVYQVYSMDVDVTTFRSVLASLLKLNEGLGTIAHDNLLSSNNLLLPPSPWPAPVWTLSNLQLQSSSSLTSGQFRVADPALVSLCDSFFSSPSVTSACSISSLSWFRAKCGDLAGAAGSSEGAVVAMATFVSVCSTTGADVTAVYGTLCSVTSALPPWLQHLCAGCVFGSITSSSSASVSNLTCSCLPGFWGPVCHDSCPGGAHNPCNGHGKCAEDGTCWCDRHWTGSACNVCARGWKGEDCIISTSFTSVSSLTADNVVGQVTPLGRVVTFDGVTFDLVKYGMFNLIHNADTQTVLAIQVVPCAAGFFSSHCISSATIGSESNRFEINPKGFSESKITLYGQSSELVVRGTLTVGKLKFAYTSFSMLTISSTDMSLNITITVVNANLLVTVSAKKDVWFTSSIALSGLMASCNTQLNVQYSKCLNQSVHVCDSTQAASLPAGCDQRLSVTALLNFVTIHRYTAPSSISPDAGSIITEACLRLNNSGTVVRSVSLPAQHFSLEFHVKMSSTAGVLVAYVLDSSSYIVLGCSGSELVVFTAGVSVKTGLSITVNVWTQVVVSWHAALSTVEIYLTDVNGVVSFKAVRLHTDVFLAGGVLSFGQPPSGLDATINVGVFRGLLDEVRVWSRPTNPSVVSQTWRMTVVDSTPDVHLHWPLNDGSGMAASERKRRSTMFALDVNHPPTWEVSDLTLTSRQDQDRGDFTLDGLDPTKHLFPVEPTTNATLLAEAQAACGSLLNNVTTSPECTGVFPDADGLKEQCIDMVYSTGSSLSAELFTLALSQFCQEKRELLASPLRAQCGQLQHVGSVLPYYGTGCSDSCMFGWTPGLSSCICYQGYWGASCSRLCPFTDLGVCSSNGLCSSVTGLCSCSPHWLHSSVTTKQYWTSSMTTTDASYACSACTAEWTGDDCSVTVTAVKVTVSWRAAVAFSNYLTTWDGASLSLITPGTYQLLEVEGLELKALFLPCPHVRLCRFISRVSITVETFHLLLSVGADDISNFTLVVRSRDELQDVSFPAKRTWGRVTLAWWLESYVRVTVDGKLSMLISGSPAGLTVGAKLHKDWFTQATGLFGAPDGNHINDLLPTSSQSFPDADVTAGKIAEHQRARFLLTSGELANVLGDALAGQNLSTCGYMLRLVHHTVTFSNLDVAIVTQQLTLTFWLRADTLLSSPTAVLEMRTSVGVVTVSVHQRLILLTWLGAGTASLRPDDIHSWTYLAITWDNGVGSLTVFAIQETGLDYNSLTTSVLSGLDFHIVGLSLLGPKTNDAAFEVDLLRVWQSAKPLEAVAQDLKVYAANPDLDPKSSLPVLMMSAAFDEGEGSTTAVSVHAGAAASSVSGVIDVGGQASSAARSVWRPSTVPLLDVALPEDVFHTRNTNASAQTCLAALQGDKLDEHCGDLHAFLSVYLEACVREHQRTGNANITATVADLMAFYCQATYEIGECVLDGYNDFCEPVPDEDDEFPVWIIIVICVSVLLSTSCCCCFIIFLVDKKKKKKKRRERSLAGSVSRLSCDEAETSFYRDSSADNGFGREDQGSIDIAFVNPTYGRGDSSASKDRRHGGPRGKKGSVGFTPTQSERPGSGFDERPHLEAWTLSDAERPISGQTGKWAKDILVDPQAPLGFYTSQDRDQRGDEMISAVPPHSTSLRPSTRQDESGAPPGAEMYRLQSVPGREMVILDELELEDPTPIFFRHDDDAFDDKYRERISSTSSRPPQPGISPTPDKISLAFDED